MELFGASCVLIFKITHFGLQDVNRYSAGRGVHINLKRAERARVTANKIPGIYFL